MLRSRPKRILLLLLAPIVVAVFALTSDSAYSSTPGLLPEQQAYLKASNTGALERFGTAVAISGDTMVVGAFDECSSATGVNGDQSDNSAADSGAAYVYVRSDGVWTQQAYLKASNTGASDYFGWSVAISGDTVVVGAFNEDSSATGVNGDQSDNSAASSGAAYVFTRSGNTWTQQAYLKASNTGPYDYFGYSVAIAGDTVVVGAYTENSNATGVNGDQSDNSAASSGAAYVFTRSAGTWTQQVYLKASNTGVNDYFGNSVAIAGDTVVVGAPYECSGATGVNGDQSDNSAVNSGAAYVFTRSGNTWTQQAYLKASNTGVNDYFGYSVAIAGDTVVVGAYAENSNATGVNGDQSDNSAASSGAAYVFTRSAGTWTQQVYLKASNTGASDYFGYSMAIAGDTVVVGAYNEDSSATGVNGDQSDNSATDSGAAYTFTRSAGTWTQEAYLKASNTDASDCFGSTLAVSGNTVVVGANWEDSNATGVNGDQSDNSSTNSGAAYAFATATATRSQQTDPKLTYLGSWSSASTWSASGGSFYYTSSAGAAVIVNFTGPWIQLRGGIAPWYGKASVSLDGEPAEEVDFYNATVLYKQPVYQKTGLDWEPHTLVIKCIGDKNTSSSGYSINLDAVDVGGVLTQAAVPERHQQDATSDFKYMGIWSTSSTWSASGGSFTYADSPGASVNVAFNGTYLAWYALKGPGYGKAQVSLDGGTPFLVDLYSPYNSYKQRVYNTGLLADGSHTLSIYWVGLKNPAAWGTKIDVDTFDLLGAHTGASKAPAILWRYQQTDSRLTYLGNWTTAATWSASGGSFNSTGATGAAVLVNFTGTSVKLYARTAPWYGKARVCLDGDWSTAELVDFYSSSTLYKQPVYERTGLSDDLHTLAIKCIGETSSSGFSISLDALDITGYLGPAPVTTRYQQNDVALASAYTGTWTTSATTWLASGGNYATANATGAQVTVNFTGSYLAWVATTAPWYGRAQLKLDDGPAFEVDLYSATTGWKRQVYNTGLLTDGPHRLTITWLGTKYWRSTGTTISVDAFDILGTL